MKDDNLLFCLVRLHEPDNPVVSHNIEDTLVCNNTSCCEEPYWEARCRKQPNAVGPTENGHRFAASSEGARDLTDFLANAGPILCIRNTETAHAQLINKMRAALQKWARTLLSWLHTQAVWHFVVESSSLNFSTGLISLNTPAT